MMLREQSSELDERLKYTWMPLCEVIYCGITHCATALARPTL